MSKEHFTAWVTKYALTTGVFKITAELASTSHDMVQQIEPETRYATYYHGNDWHRTHDEAIVRAEQMRTAKLKSIDKQRARIVAMKFS